MEFLDGQTLKHVIADPSMELENLLDLAIQAADALDAAHSKGIVHRDIKPANIFVTKRGHVKILDFGLAKVARRKSRRPRRCEPPWSPWGWTPAPWLAQPRHFDGHGCLHVAGASPRQGTRRAHGPFLFWNCALRNGHRISSVQRRKLRRNFRFDSAQKSRRARPAPIHTLPPEFEQVISKAMEKDRDLRYQSAAEMRADLKRLRRDTKFVHVNVQSGSFASQGNPGSSAAVPSANPQPSPPGRAPGPPWPPRNPAPAPRKRSQQSAA